MRVAVLGGGRSGEHDVSLASEAAVREGLAAAGHTALDLTVTREGRWIHDGVELGEVSAAGSGMFQNMPAGPAENPIS